MHTLHFAKTCTLLWRPSWYLINSKYTKPCVFKFKIIKRERKNAQNRKQKVNFCMHICKHGVISDYPFSCLTSVFKFCMQTAFQINSQPFAIDFIRRYTYMDLHQKMFEFSSNMAATIHQKENVWLQFLLTPFWMTYFKFYQTSFERGVRTSGFWIKNIRIEYCIVFT